MNRNVKLVELPGKMYEVYLQEILRISGSSERVHAHLKQALNFAMTDAEIRELERKRAVTLPPLGSFSY